MTSDLARAPEGASMERKRLAQMLSGYCVSLKKLRPDEFDELLRKVLSSLHLRGLRGFKALRQTISSGGDEPTNPDEQTEFVAEGFDDCSFNMDTQTQTVHNGVISQELVWREHETGEETTEYIKSPKWGANSIVRGTQTFLVLMRLSNSFNAIDNLVMVTILSWAMNY